MPPKRKFDAIDKIDSVKPVKGSHDYIQKAVLFSMLTRIAGDIEFIKQVTGFEVIFEKNDKYGIHFHTARGSGNSGHFVFIDKTGQVFNSYQRGWQIAGSNGFCQTFAMMSSLGLHTRFQGRNKIDCSRLCAEFLLSHIKLIHEIYLDVVHEYIYDYDKLSVSELGEDIQGLIDYPLFWDIVTEEIDYY